VAQDQLGERGDLDQVLAVEGHPDTAREQVVGALALDRADHPEAPVVLDGDQAGPDGKLQPGQLLGMQRRLDPQLGLGDPAGPRERRRPHP
jgi:hypothetical protein